uniref:Uncharacterized protein n=1 Tax=Brassica campestris TaxID=3711 RepID=M4CJC7_BRACM
MEVMSAFFLANRSITSASLTIGEPPTDSSSHTGALPLHTLLTTTAKLSHASKSGRINRSFEISSTIVPHKHQREVFAHTSLLLSERYTHPPTRANQGTRAGGARHMTLSPPGDKAGNVGTVGASTFRKLSRRRKAKEAFTNPRKTSCQERSSSRDKTLTQIHQHVGENHRSEPTARRNERNEKEESHRRRHAQPDAGATLYAILSVLSNV